MATVFFARRDCRHRPQSAGEFRGNNNFITRTYTRTKIIMAEISETTFAATAAYAAAYAAETDALAAEAMHLCAMAAEIKFDQAGRSRRRGRCGRRGNPLGSMRARMEAVARRLDERGLCEAAAQLRRWAE